MGEEMRRLQDNHREELQKVQDKLVQQAQEIGAFKSRITLAEAEAEAAKEAARRTPAGKVDELQAELSQALQKAASLQQERDRYQTEAHLVSSEVIELRREASIPQSPSMVQYQALSTQVERLEARAAKRE